MVIKDNFEKILLSLILRNCGEIVFLPQQSNVF